MKHSPRARKLAVVVAVGALTLLPACGGGDSSSPKAGDSVLRVVTNSEPTDLDTCNWIGEANRRVLFSNVSEGLTQINPKSNEVEPLLATKWEQVTPTEWSFTLRDDVNYHDGKKFNAETAAAAIDRVFLPDLACNVAAQNFGEVKLTAKATGDYTVMVTSSRPDPILPRRMFNLGITAPSADLKALDNKAVGTGPYQLDSWDRAEKLTLKAFDGYWGDAPAISEVVYLFRPEDTVRDGMIKSDEADIALAMGPKDASSPLAKTFPGEDSAYLTMPTAHGPFDDIRVRRAVALGINRKGMIKAIWGGAGDIPTQAVAGHIDGFNPNVKAPTYDPDAARALLAEAKSDGVDIAKPVVLHYRLARFPGVETFAQSIQSQLKDIGLNVASLKGLESSAYFDFLRAKDTEGMMIETAGNPLGDASLTVDQRFFSSRPRSRVPADNTKKIDAMAVAASAASGETRTKLYQELFAEIDANVVQETPIAEIPGVLLVRKGVDYTPSNDSSTVLRLADIKFAN